MILIGGDYLAFTNFGALLNDLKKDVDRIGDKIAKGVADVAYEDLQIAHQEIMNSYYAGYTPVDSYYFFYEKDGRLYQGQAHGYRRTGNLRKSLSPIGVTGAGKHSYTATVEVSSANMGDYKIPGSAVFNMIWNQGIRGLPPGNIGHIGDVEISAAPVGVAISGIPVQAMSEFVDTWGYQRGPQVADMIAFSV